MQELEKQARASSPNCRRNTRCPPAVTLEITGLTLEKIAARLSARTERARAQEAGEERMASREIRRDSFTRFRLHGACPAPPESRHVRLLELFDEDMTRAELITMFMALLKWSGWAAWP